MHEFLIDFAAFLDSGRWLKLLLLVIGVMSVWIMIKVQHGNNRVDFKDMVMEDGHASPTKFFAAGCFIASTWGFIVLANNNQLQEWYFNGYIFLWCGNRLGTKWLDFQRELKLGRPPTPPPGSTVNAEVPAGSTASVTITPPPPAGTS